jgi:hypothetical protein
VFVWIAAGLLGYGNYPAAQAAALIAVAFGCSDKRG